MKLRAFSLIESVIVLGVVALVLGAIWAGASRVRELQRLNEAAAIITQAAYKRDLFPIQAYPTTNGSGINVTSTAINSGVLPANMRLINSNQEALAPIGISFRVSMSCYSNCPMYAVTMSGPAQTARQSRVSGAECNQIIRRVAGLSKDRDDFLYAQIAIAGNSSYQFLYPPFDGNSVNCPEGFDYVVFWFKPKI